MKEKVEKKEKNNKTNNLLMLIMILVLGVVLTVGAYAFIEFVLLGNKEQTIEISGLTFTYTEAASGLSIQDTTPLSDAEGIASDNDFTFNITASSGSNKTVSYYIYLTLNNISEVNNDNVKFYLVNNTTSSITGPFTVNDLIAKTDTTNSYYLHGDSFNLSANVAQTHNYTLTVWVSETLEGSVGSTTSGDTQIAILDLGSFKFKINVATGTIPS